MLDAMLTRLNRWALRHIGRDWVDYIASNTMTDFNRRWNDFIWTYDLKAIVTSVRDEAPGVKTFTLMPNQRWQGMEPGQFVAVHAKINGQDVSRCYSLSPLEDDCFTITVRKIQGGQMSTWLHEQVHAGMVLRLDQPQGHFCYRQQSKVLFICAGTGITPCYAMLKSLMGYHVRPDLAMYAQFSGAQDIIFKDTLPAWRQQGLQLTLALSRPTPADRDQGLYAPTLDVSNIDQLLPDFRERDIYLCGPQGFMDKVETILKEKGYDMARVDRERFVAPMIKPLAPADFKTAQAEIHFRHLNRHVQLTEADQGLTLMQIAERHKVPIETGCRQGLCGTCKLTLREGEVVGQTLGNAVYLCTSFPASTTVVLDA
jgi:ferredoxin-NADP reductase